MGDKTTIMVLKVDLQCCSCYKKVKKILCKFPQIRNQDYDEKKNTVTISVVCCDPEKLRDKLCSKGCGVIKSIEIKEPPKSKPPEKRKETPKPQPVPPPPEPEPVPKPQPVPPPPAPVPKPQPVTPPPAPVPKPQPVTPPPAPEPVCKMPMPIQEYPQPPPGYCCGQCYEGHTGGPCYQLYGRPVPPPPCYHYYGYIYGPCGCGRGCYVSRCDQYVFSDENVTGCSIM